MPTVPATGSLGEALRFDESQQYYVLQAAERAASEPNAYVECAPGDATLYRFYTWFPPDRRGQILAGASRLYHLDPNENGWHRSWVPAENPLHLPWDPESNLADSRLWVWVPRTNRKTEAVIALFCWYLARAQTESEVVG